MAYDGMKALMDTIDCQDTQIAGLIAERDRLLVLLDECRTNSLRLYDERDSAAKRADAATRQLLQIKTTTTEPT